MLEQTLQASGLSAIIQKLLLDLYEQIGVVGDIDIDDKFDAAKVRSALFALITARIEDAHEIAVMGQSSKTDQQLISELASDLEANLEEIQVLLDASALFSAAGVAAS